MLALLFSVLFVRVEFVCWILRHINRRLSFEIMWRVEEFCAMYR